MHLDLYPYIHLNSAYSADIIANVYAFFFCLILILTVTMHATLTSGRRMSISPLIKKKKKSLNAQTPNKRKPGLTTQSCAPSKPKSCPSPPHAPLALVGTAD